MESEKAKIAKLEDFGNSSDLRRIDFKGLRHWRAL
jgi:hypothetical protein